jgi:hypothetical protein
MQRKKLDLTYPTPVGLVLVQPVLVKSFPVLLTNLISLS